MTTPTRLYVEQHGEQNAVKRKPQQAKEAPVRDGGRAGLLSALQRSAGNTAVNHLLRQYVQRQEEDEEQAQAKHEGVAIQRAGDEDEEQAQAKFADASPVQRAGEEDEEQAQAKFVDSPAIQRESEDEDEQGQAQAKHEGLAIQRAGEEDEEQAQAKHEGLTIQRAGDEEEEAPAQAKFLDAPPVQREEDEEEAPAQAKAEVGREGGPLSRPLVAQIQGKRGGGAPLDEGTRKGMEGAFGTSFADVRVHTDGEAHALNRSISAVAFTTGNDIFFREGAYNPADSSGRALLGHELTHVVQQRSMGASGPMRVGPAGDGYEQEADAKGAAVARAIEPETGTVEDAHG